MCAGTVALLVLASVASATRPVAALSASAMSSAAAGAGNGGNRVLSGPARISVLTESLFRLEWDAERRFVDEPSLIFESASSALPGC